MPRNTKKIVIGSIIIVVILIIIIGVLIYTLTDIFRPANVTFLKYASQNGDVLSSIFNVKEESEYLNKLESNKYESNAVINSNTSISDQKDLSDIINKFTININTKSDKPNSKEYGKMILNYDKGDILNLEYNKQNDIYGVKFSDVVTKYVSVQNSDLKELAEKLGLDSTNIPDKIENYSYQDIFSLINFTTEEKEKLAKEYGTTIINTIPQDKFVKQTNQMITVNGTTITANAYTLNTNKQQLKELTVKILEQLSNDEIILNKIDAIDTEIEKSEELKTKLRDQYTAKISEIIENLNNDENKESDAQQNIKIIVYEKNRQLIRTEIDTDYIKTNIDVSKTDSKSTMNIEMNETTQTDYKSIIFKLSKDTNGTTQNIVANLQLTENDKTYSGEIERIRKQEGNSLSTEVNIKAAQDNSNYQVAYKNDISIVDSLDIEDLTDKNNIVLNNLSDENVQKIKNVITEKESTKFSEKMQPILNRVYAETSINNVESMLDNSQSEVKVLDADKNSFNAKFEGYTGNKVKYTNMQTLLENLKNYDSAVNIDELTGEITISIQKDTTSPVSLDEVNSKIDSSKTYTVNLEYDTNNIASKITIKANS